MVFIKVMSGSEKNNDDLFENDADKAVKTENFKRAMEEISHILHKYSFDVDEVVALLSAILTTGFLQMVEKGYSLDSIKCMMNELSEEMYQKVKKITKKKEK